MNIFGRRAEQVEHIYHVLNQSKTKAAYSFQKSDRFRLDKSFSPDRFYDVPSQFKSLSPHRRKRFQSSLEKDKTTNAWDHYLSSSLDEKDLERRRANTSTFGISREEYYRGRKDKLELGPGSYNLKGSFQKKPFYMGQKTERSMKSNNQPNCASYTVTKQSLNKLSTSRDYGTVKMKGQYYPKSKLQAYDNRVPGPGSCSYDCMQTVKGVLEIMVDALIVRISIEKKCILHSGWVSV